MRPDSDSQQQRPGYRARRRQVLSMLERQFGAERAAQMLQGDEPQPARFPNKATVQQEWDFVREGVEALLEAGAWITWQDAGMSCPPDVISAIGVAVDRKGKRRIVVDGRYINLWLLYLLFRYESFGTALAHVRPGDFMWTFDFKSGYHQVCLGLLPRGEVGSTL